MEVIAKLVGSYVLHSLFPNAYKEEDVILDNSKDKETSEEQLKDKKETLKDTVKDISDDKTKEAEGEKVKADSSKKEEAEKDTTKKETEAPKVEIPVKEKKTKTVNYKIKDDDKITMQDRKICPVKVPVASKNNNVNTTEHSSFKGKKITDVKEEEHHLSHLVEHLRTLNVNFTPPKRMPTGLYELDLIQMNGNPVRLSFDINGQLYSNEIKFFFGRVNPGEEYMKPAIMMTRASIEAIVKGSNIPNKYYISESLFNLNKVLDLQTLKETDKKKRGMVFEKAAKVISDPDIYNGIIKAANGEAFRFAFCRYNSTDDFSLVSSKRNLSSNLTDDKLRVSKEIWINVKGRDVQLTTKNYK